MKNKNLGGRIKASVLSAVMAASAVSAAALSTPAIAAVTPSVAVVNNVGLSQKMAVDDSYEGTFPAAGAKSITFTVTAEYATSFSYGLGVSTAESPYWTEHNKTGGWDSKGSGYSVDLKVGKNTITVDLSDVDIKGGGTFEFRCYYSAHWDNSVSDMVDDSVTLTGVEFDAAATTDPDDPDDPLPSNTDAPHNNRQSATNNWTFKDNGNGTATISSTIAKQIDFSDDPIILTQGYDDDYYKEHPDENVEGAPINSHKFYYSDFGITDMQGTKVESLTAVIQTEVEPITFMYGGGLNVLPASAADTEYAKQLAGIEGKESAAYWYNDMGTEEQEKFEAAGVKFLVEPGHGVTFTNPGTYFEAYWEVPAAVQECLGEKVEDAISFQYWYGTTAATETETEGENASKEAPLETVQLTSAVITYTKEVTVPYTSSKTNTIGKSISHEGTDDAKNLKIKYADLGIEENMDVYAVLFTISADSDVGKFVYNVGTSLTDSEKYDYWYQEDGDYVVLDAGKKVEIMWIVPNDIAGSDAETNLVSPDGEILLGYYYGEADSVTVDSIELFYEVPKTTTEETFTTTTTTTTTATTTTTTTTTTTKATTTSTATTTVPETTTTEGPKVSMWGDANCDDKVNMSDVVFIMQAGANPGEFQLTAVGKLNADVFNNPDGVTNNDALAIQRYEAGLITNLDPSSGQADNYGK